jgi:hypothetical protein
MKFKGVTRMTAKEKHAERLLVYLANPANEWLDKSKLSTEILEKDKSYINKTWTSQEFTEEIADPALELRRASLAPISAQIDKALVKRCLEGDPQSIRLFYQRLEGWQPSKKTELKAEFGGLTLAQLLDDLADEADNKRA